MYVEASILNPLNFVDKSRELLPNYQFKHFDAWHETEQRLAFQQGGCFYQKWQKNDTIRLQVKTDMSPAVVKLKNNIGAEVFSEVMTSAAVVNGITYRQSALALDAYDGYYKIELHVGDGAAKVMLESNTFYVRQSWPGTLLHEYSNDFNNEILWETDIYFTLRVDGVIADFTPGSQRTTYIDQPQAAKTVKGNAFRQFKVFYGNVNNKKQAGLPDWMADKLEEIYIQNNLDIDGKGFAAVPGAKLTPKRIPGYLYAPWEMEVQESLNRRVKRFDSTGLLEQKVAIDYVVEGALFGPIAGPANTNEYTINELG